MQGLSLGKGEGAEGLNKQLFLCFKTATWVIWDLLV
jgi:hypothetical protein